MLLTCVVYHLSKQSQQFRPVFKTHPTVVDNIFLFIGQRSPKIRYTITIPLSRVFLQNAGKFFFEQLRFNLVTKRHFFLIFYSKGIFRWTKETYLPITFPIEYKFGQRNCILTVSPKFAIAFFLINRLATSRISQNWQTISNP